jgi:hypothetical protein
MKFRSDEKERPVHGDNSKDSQEQSSMSCEKTGRGLPLGR